MQNDGIIKAVQTQVQEKKMKSSKKALIKINVKSKYIALARDSIKFPLRLKNLEKCVINYTKVVKF
jgi:hypothetical protein